MTALEHRRPAHSRRVSRRHQACRYDPPQTESIYLKRATVLYCDTTARRSAVHRRLTWCSSPPYSATESGARFIQSFEKTHKTAACRSTDKTRNQWDVCDRPGRSGTSIPGSSVEPRDCDHTGSNTAAKVQDQLAQVTPMGIPDFEPIAPSVMMRAFRCGHYSAAKFQQCSNVILAAHRSLCPSIKYCC